MESPYLRGLSTGAVRLLERAGEVVEHANGVELPPDRLYLLLDGEVAAATLPDADGVREVVGHERRGAMFGSVAITSEPDQLMYRAVGQVRLRQWGQAVASGRRPLSRSRSGRWLTSRARSR